MNGAQNGPADALSCVHMNTLHIDPNITVDFKEMAAAQENNPEPVQLKSSPSLPLYSETCHW